MMATAQEISQQPGHWWFDQLNNADAAPGYRSMGEEIWRQSGGKVDAFVQSVGSAHSLNSVARVLREHNADLHVVAVEPAESAVLSGKVKGSHKIEGIGIGFVPPHWRPDEVSEMQSATTEEAMRMCRRLAREEGIFTGARSVACSTAAVNRDPRLGSCCRNKRPTGGIRAGQARRSECVSPRAASFCEHVLSGVRGKFAAIERFDAPLDRLRPSGLDVSKRLVQRLEHRLGKLRPLFRAQSSGAIFNLFEIRLHEMQ
jgi:hypothetical protein